MSIIETALNTAVHYDKDVVYSVKNILAEPFSFKIKGDDNVERTFEIPAGMTLMFPKYIAVELSIKIAQSYLYSQCEDKAKWKGFYKEQWLPTAETLISDPNTKKEEEPVEEEVKKEEVKEEIKEEPVEEKKEVGFEKKEINLEEVSYNDLLKIAKERGIKAGGMKKQELIELLK